MSFNTADIFLTQDDSRATVISTEEEEEEEDATASVAPVTGTSSG